ncbi:MAG: TetR/AcrR family transcriptional regulator [Roseburia sp.]|nr:TetR/AcrR family transcriptional regulator [Roseburia sp.]
MNNGEQKVFFQHCLYDALIKLMNDKPFSDISISDLCDAAGVSRMTYYRSYKCKEDILMQHLEECFCTYLERLQTSGKMTFYDISVSFFEFWQGEEQVFLSAIIRSGLSSQLVDCFYAYLEQIYISMDFEKKVDPFIRSFLAGGLYKMLIDWMKDGAVTSIEEMASFLAKGSQVLTAL